MYLKIVLLVLLITATVYFVYIVPKIEEVETFVPRTAQE